MSIQVNDKNLGHATAYAYAVAGGYTGTEAEFTELLGNIADDLEQIENLTVTVETLAAGSSATASYSNGVLHLGIPKGDKGDKGDTGATGPTGPTGNGIASVAKTGTSGLVDTYTITYTNDNTSTFTVTNGAEAVDNTLTIAGRAADAKKTGDEISELKEDLTDKADAVDMLKAFPTDTASGAVASFDDGANVPVKSLIVNIDPVQSGSGDPSPTNIRPISGWSEVNVVHTGGNVFDKETATPNSSISAQGAVKSGSFYVSDLISVKPDTDYYIRDIEVSFHARSLCFYGADKSFISAQNISGGDSVHAVSFVKHIPSNVYYIRIMVHPDYIDSAGVNYPATDQDYHPYSGQSINIALGQTVYGGTLDVVSGELVIDRAMVDLGSLNWQLSAAGTDHERFTYADSTLLKGSVCLCDRLQTTAYSDMYNHIIDNSIAVHPNSQQVEAYVSAYTDVNSFRTAMSGSQFCYGLATPLTIQLAPHEVNTLLGSNNVWADTGDSTVEYRADPTLYISRLTEPDADMVADSNITSGSYFMVGNTLYKATANIASGGAITPNVNCTRKSLSEALNELNA